MNMNWIVVGAASGFLGVALGAFGAHGLEGHVTDEGLAWWRTGVLYQLIHAPLLLVLGLLALQGRRVCAAGWCFLIGTLVFSGTLYAMALGAPRWFGAVTPIGGVLLLVGWVLLALAARRLPLNAA